MPRRPEPASPDRVVRLSRRAFLQGGTLTLLAAGLPRFASADAAAPVVRFGLVTDLHHADKPPAGTRHYRETAAKLAEAVERFAAERPDFTVELGDLIDAAPEVATEKWYLVEIRRRFAEIPGPKRYVLGNHCVDTLTKEEFLGGVEQERAFDAFDAGGVRFVALDSCFRSDGVAYGRRNSKWDDANVPPDQLEWLADALAGAPGPAVVLAHQRLDGSDRHCVKNAAAVRKVLEASGRVAAVFQGHSHQNDHKEIAGIHYCTLAAMIEGTGPASNGYALAEMSADGTLRVRGFRRQASYEWS